MVANNPRGPKARKGTKRSRSGAPTPGVNTATVPWTMKNARITTSTVTSRRCSPPVSFVPNTFTAAKTSVRATATGLIGTS